MSEISEYSTDSYAPVNQNSFMINPGTTVYFDDNNLTEKLNNLRTLRNIIIENKDDSKEELILPNTIEFSSQYNKFKNEEKKFIEELNNAETNISKIKNNQQILLKALQDLDVNKDTFEMIQSVIIPHTTELIEKYNLTDTQSKLKDIQDKLAIYLVLLSEVKNEFFTDTKDIDNWTCSICYESKIDMVITSCGHTLCNKCREKLKDNCFICRKKIDKVIKLFTI